MLTVSLLNLSSRVPALVEYRSITFPHCSRLEARQNRHELAVAGPSIFRPYIVSVAEASPVVKMKICNDMCYIMACTIRFLRHLTSMTTLVQFMAVPNSSCDATMNMA